MNGDKANELSALSPSRHEELRRFFAQPCDFVLAAAMPDHFDSIPVDLPEVAFWGRSNVGKSSLINAVTGRKGLARASNTPGRTQQIVFFNMAGRFLFADLPGYGYAKASKVDIKKWNNFIDVYLKKRLRLRCVVLLVDGRHGAMKNDIEKMDLLDSLALSYQVVMTKTDQVRGADPLQTKIELEKLLTTHAAARPEVIMTSAEKGLGIPELRNFLLETAV